MNDVSVSEAMVTKCTVCGTDNPDEARLCVKCRATLPAMTARESAELRSKWNLTSLSLVLGVLLYLAGTIVYLCRFFFRATWLNPEHNHFWEWSIVAKDVGVVLFLLGIALYVVGRRKGV